VKLARASTVLVLSMLYLGYVFNIADGRFWTAGLAEWLDPYFINALLEHWFHVARTLADPASPPMYFPALKTLGYSHGLILYAPFYVPLRFFLHPFQGYNVTLLLVIETGVLCLYLLLRRMGLSFVESVVLTAFFVTSPNVMNRLLGVWLQRASVFLIPPILLVIHASRQMRAARPRLALAAAGGLLATLMYVQDFYTAHFAVLFAMLAAAAAGLVERPRGTVQSMATFWREESRPSRVALTAALVSAGWTLYVWMFGGVDTRVLGVRLASRDWLRPALVALAAGAVSFAASAGIRRRARMASADPWVRAFGTGAAVGALVFLWIYVGAYREHRAFPEDQLWNQLAALDPSRWRGPLDALGDLNAYDSYRTLALVFILSSAAWWPSFRIDRKIRVWCLWSMAISLLVLLIPLRLNGFSIWTTLVGRLPGFEVIRDPKRIIYLYELAAVLAIALFVTRLPAKAAYRAPVVLVVVFFIVAWSRGDQFDYGRPNAAFDRWVAAPIDIDPWCQSFYIKGASQEYMSRSPHMWSLYNVDAFFVAMNHSIPTLNGYSAWWPEGWRLDNPQNAGYDAHVRRWILTHHLRHVCELDIDVRTMKPGIR
jgi:hypothetical protein